MDVEAAAYVSSTAEYGESMHYNATVLCSFIQSQDEGLRGLHDNISRMPLYTPRMNELTGRPMWAKATTTIHTHTQTNTHSTYGRGVFDNPDSVRYDGSVCLYLHSYSSASQSLTLTY